MSENYQDSSKEKRRWRSVAALGLLVTAGSVLFLDKHEVSDPKDAAFSVTRITDSQETLTHVDEVEIPFAIAGIGGIVVTALAAGALLEIRREQSADDNHSDQL